jgi:hypothetical protein
LNPVTHTQTVNRPIKEWSLNEKTGLVSLVALAALSLAATAILLITNRTNLKPALFSIPFVVSASCSFVSLTALIAFSIIFSRKKEALPRQEAQREEIGVETPLPSPIPPAVQPPKAPVQPQPIQQPPNVDKEEEDIFYTPHQSPRSTSPVNEPPAPALSAPHVVGYLSVEAMEAQRSAFTESVQKATSHEEARAIFKEMIVIPAAKSLTNFLTVLVTQIYKLGDEMPPALKNGKVSKEQILDGISNFESRICESVMEYLAKQNRAAMDAHFETCLKAEIKKNTNWRGKCSLTADQQEKIRSHYKEWRALANNENDLSTYKKMLTVTITPTHELFGFLMYIAAKLKYSDWGKQVSTTGLTAAQFFGRCKDALDDPEHKQVADNFKGLKLDRYYPFYSAGDSQFHVLWADLLRVVFVPFLSLVQTKNPGEEKLKDDFWKTLVNEGLPTTDEALKPDTSFETDFFELMLKITEKYRA